MGGTGAGTVIGVSHPFDGEGLRWPLGHHTHLMEGVGIVVVDTSHV